MLSEFVARHVLFAYVQTCGARLVAPEQQRFVFFNRRRRLTKVKSARLVLKIRFNSQRHVERVREEILRRRFAHVHAHAGAPRLLQPSALCDLYFTRDGFVQVVFGRRLHRHRTNHPREYNLTDFRVQF